jgi:RNase P/RNase MRP subunit POP5
MQTTRTLVPEFVYIRIAIDGVSLREEELEDVVAGSLLQTFGNAGSARLLVQVVEFDAGKSCAILRTNADSKEKVWVALTFISTVNCEPARFVVSSITPHLLALGD